MKIEVLPVVQGQREWLIPDDLSETETESIREFLTTSKYVWSIVIEDVLVGCMGLIVGTLVSRDAYFWFHNTPDLDRFKFVFARHSREVVNEILRHYPHVTGHCVRSDLNSQRWLRWLGAEFEPDVGPITQFQLKAR